MPLFKPMLILEMIGRAGGSARWSIGARVHGGRTCVHRRSMLDGMEHLTVARVSAVLTHD